ncbi:hypothetical protein P4O66_002056 [Electrophorus voltai]|uniref:Uncharacterized protein n=1 Tax=Electrophorus voltai TaxID=2609070 RepID=A0AAD8Z128_9TELE|nr:hypothetical protein P4O66_002056 [Electrophorus voltai]
MEQTTAEHLMEQTTAERLIEQTTAEHLMEQTTAERLMEQTTAERLIEQTTAEHLMEQTTAERLIEQTTAEHLMEQTTAERLIEQTTAEHLMEQTTAERLMEQTTAERLIEQTTAEHLMEQTTAERLIEQTTAERLGLRLEAAHLVSLTRAVKKPLQKSLEVLETPPIVHLHGVASHCAASQERHRCVLRHEVIADTRHSCLSKHQLKVSRQERWGVLVHMRWASHVTPPPGRPRGREQEELMLPDALIYASYRLGSTGAPCTLTEYTEHVLEQLQSDSSDADSSDTGTSDTNSSDTDTSDTDTNSLCHGQDYRNKNKMSDCKNSVQEFHFADPHLWPGFSGTLGQPCRLKLAQLRHLTVFSNERSHETTLMAIKKPTTSSVPCSLPYFAVVLPR